MLAYGAETLRLLVVYFLGQPASSAIDSVVAARIHFYRPEDNSFPSLSLLCQPSRLLYECHGQPQA
jgi:hypothetical protein